MIIDSPPLAATLDVAMLGSLADGIAVVVRAHRTHRELVRKSIEQLRSARGPILGVILTCADVPKNSIGSYYYQREYQKTGA